MYSSFLGDTVQLSPRAMKALRSLPSHIAVKLKSWAELVEAAGIFEARKLPGYHDEPLRGDRAGQRSIRLSRSYRAIYTMNASGPAKIIRVEEVNKHDY